MLNGFIPYDTISRGVWPATNIYLGELPANGSVLMTVRYVSGRRTIANTRDLEITYPVRLFKSCYASLDMSLVLVGVASFYRILIVQRRARASQLHKRSAHLKS